MLLPIRTSIKPWRTPYANYAFIAVNIIIFFAQYGLDPVTGSVGFRLWVQYFMLTPVRPHIWQFVSYAFLHGGFLHILGNMFFLYLFGNNVNDKLGHIGYTCFYLAGAVFSAIGHTLVSNNPVLGASGAVAAVTGAYLVLFPQTLITVIYWFLFIGTMELPALYFIAFKMIFIDNIITRYTPNVAYDAHLAGYAFGIAAMLLMLAAGLIKSDHLDLWSMLKRWNRRRQYQDVVSSGFDPFTGLGSTKKIKVKEVKKSPAQIQKDEKIKNLREQIASRIAQRNISAAAETYLVLVQLDPKQIIPRQYLLDIANQLASQTKHTEAADAYEQFLTHYPTYEYVEQVQLMLGIIYSRYLENPSLARKYLQAAAQKLTDPAQLKMCSDELKKLKR
jgi:membrane associated rhomboid family serine protease